MATRFPNQTNADVLDVLIVGAGLSGIGAACHLQTKCPGKSYAILEARPRMGGTWDLFRYPGIRSDSDMYTLGYSFRPWSDAKAIADGPAILAYIEATSRDYGVDRHVRYGLRVESASWSSREACWTVTARETSSGDTRSFKARFLLACAGYYDYESGYTPDLPGMERFRGRIVHPQQWTPDIAYEGKRVVVIGSGATAVTLVPELARTAAHVTMLQRSPTYVVSAPEKDRVATFLRGKLPARTAYGITRWKNVALGMAFFAYCRRYPSQAKRLIVSQVRRHLRGSVPVNPHFTPSYNPWDQRLCLVPDADLFDALREGRASVVTDHIDTFTEDGIRLRSGTELQADLVVTATGLKLKFLGGIDLEVDGRRLQPNETMVYKGMMFGDVPNLAFAIGYTNASWTLKCDLTSEYVCRLLNHMDRRGLAICVPRADPSVEAEPLLDFTSGYVRRSIDQFPRQGSRIPWRVYQNYALDRIALKNGKLEDGVMTFSPASV
jgi:cation diffusion facilitator CzcD-associated flavoprotein CzcO